MPSQSHPQSPADIRSRLVSGFDAATEADAHVEQVARPSPPGFVVWRIVGTTRPATMVPALLLHAPGRVQRGYHARIVANLTGTCPLCTATAWIDTDADPEHTPAGWSAIEVSVGIVHLPGCLAAVEVGRALRENQDARYRAIQARQGRPVIDEPAVSPPKTGPVTTKPAARKRKPPTKAKPPPAPTSTLPPGSVVLSRTDAALLDHLLSTHPDMQ